MPHTIFLQDLINQLIIEMSTSISDQCSRVPNRVNMWLRRNLATTLVSLVRVGIASTHLEM